MKKYQKLLKKLLLSFLVICMTMGLITAKEKAYALGEEALESVPATLLCENTDLRKESIKYFTMSDKTKQAIVYSMPIHYNNGGEWREIDNSLIDDGLEYIDDNEGESYQEEVEIETNQDDNNAGEENYFVESEISGLKEETIEDQENINAIEEDSSTENVTEENNTAENNEVGQIETQSENSGSNEVTGYKNKEGKYKIKFSKKVHKKNMVSFSDGDYKVTWGFSDFINKSSGIVTKTSNSNDDIEDVLDRINQEIVYANVLDGIDLIYNIDSLSIKENIIVNKIQDINKFTFEYKVDKLELELNNAGDIIAKNSAGNSVFVMPKPFMYDSNGNYCDNVHYEITNKNKKYTITIVADKEWMNNDDRVYPLTIDPVIKTETTKSAIDTTFITSSLSTTNHHDKLELLVGKEKSEYGNCRTLVKFVLPELNKSDMIVDAQLNIASYKHGFYASTTPDLQFNAHMATSAWEYDTVTWNTRPSFESVVLDYDYIKRADTTGSANWKKFDITRAAKKWYNGTANHGIVLKSYNESGTYADTGVKGYLWPERYNSTTKSYPYIALTYRNNKGIEDYWDFSSVSTTSAGDLSINNYSGNPVIQHLDASTNGNKKPVNISHIYNGYMAGSNISNIKPYVGKGWKLNIQQTVRPSSEYGLTGTSATTYPYVYMDEDGTDHYFKNIESQYFDEDGLGLELVKTSAGYTITDDSDNVMTFDSSGNIIKITDSNNNSITFTYSSSILTKVTDGNNQTITLTYDDNNYLTKITDFANRETTYTYNNGLLTKISYNDGKTSQYTYDSDNALNKMISSDGTSITLSYTSLASGKKVSQIVEKGNNDTVGQTVKFNRNDYNTTTITTSGVDTTIGTNDDIKTVLQFDNTGRLSSRYAYTSEKELGAESVEYTSSSPNSTGSDIKKLNKLSKTGLLSRITYNYLVNHSGESTSLWKSSSSVGSAEFTFEATDEEKIYGQKSLKLNASSCETIGRARFYQDLNTIYIKANTTYTVSAYIKTKDINKVEGGGGYGAALLVYINAPSMPTSEDPEAADYISEYITGTTDEKVNDGWRRVSITFTTPSDVSYIRINGIIRGATGTAYFDALQLEEGNVSNPYNMVENGSFERTSSSFPASWTGVNLTSSDIADTAVKKHGNNSLKITSSVQVNKHIFQNIPITGKEEDTYIVSGWGYGKAVKQTSDDRKFKISIKITYSDNSTKWKYPMEFNTSISGWQYDNRMFDLSDGTSAVKQPIRISLYLMDYNQANTLYFDNIQLLKKSVSYNTYDSNGNVISSNGETYTYTDGNMTSLVDEDGITTNYTYDNNNNLTSIITDTGVENELVYDEYGNIVEENVTGDSLKIKTEAVYDSTGSYQLKSVDEDGRTTFYDYDTSKGILNSVSDAKGNKTEYTYDDCEQLTKIISNGVLNTITYDSSGRLSQLSNIGSLYTFTYDSFGNMLETKVGNSTLATDTYGNYNGNIVKRTLGNGHSNEYVYDEYGNLVLMKENSKTIEEDVYDTLGNMIKSYDYKTNMKLQLDYDINGQIVRIDAYDNSITGMNDSRLYGVEYGYDDNGNLIRQIDYVGDERKIKDYTYGEEKQIESITLDSSRKLNYSYDSLDRMISKKLDTSSNIITSYEYADSLRGSEYTTSKVSKETIGDREYTYTYDELGNITKIVIKNGNETQQIDYEYDANSQIIRENNQQINKTITYEYDTAGNIQTKKEYGYTTGTLAAVVNTVSYIYDNSNWKDQLTSYNGEIITYDSIGNPLKYRNYNMTWNGRELLSMDNGNDKIEYTYGSDGMRRTKNVNGVTTTYDYVGDVLIHEIRKDCELYYTYDTAGSLVKITYVKNGTSTVYYVTTNTNGDVEAIYSETGVLQARYIYDTWGNTVSVLDNSGNKITDTAHIGIINPIRYRGYYLDSETGLYYLQSRYYDAEVTRFINADDTDYISEDILGTNIYAYCGNNPVMYSDPEGHLRIKRDRVANWIDFALSFTPLASAFKPAEWGVKKILNQIKKKLNNKKGKQIIKNLVKKLIKVLVSKSIRNFLKGLIKAFKKKVVITAFSMLLIPVIGKAMAKQFINDILDLNLTILMNIISKIANGVINNIDIFFSAGSFISAFFDYYSDKKLNGYITV
ncbi:MAG: DNRLRE domain-containing protein [Bacilli bacterium]|nr:DNRLRE domain-containing protein [Bacilli bacterium]